MPGEHIGELKKWLGEIARKSDGAGAFALTRVVDLIGKNFGVQPHEVAVLEITSDERYLRFLTPENLRAVGQIPLSSTSSLAARTVREKRAEIVNHFTVVRHASVFEAVPIAEEQRGDPIQKIMSAPIKLASRMIGVLQVSRKGKSAGEAGPDFTHAQLRELQAISDAMAPCLHLAGKD